MGLDFLCHRSFPASVIHPSYQPSYPTSDEERTSAVVDRNKSQIQPTSSIPTNERTNGDGGASVVVDLGHFHNGSTWPSIPSCLDLLFALWKSRKDRRLWCWNLSPRRGRAGETSGNVTK